jgi:hypothetical protein
VLVRVFRPSNKNMSPSVMYYILVSSSCLFPRSAQFKFWYVIRIAITKLCSSPTVSKV